MKGIPLGPDWEDITWPDQVAPRDGKASSTLNLKTTTANLIVHALGECVALRWVRLAKAHFNTHRSERFQVPALLSREPDVSVGVDVHHRLEQAYPVPQYGLQNALSINGLPARHSLMKQTQSIHNPKA